MRNLKRALSLAMASVMILGMMVVGAGAASLNDFSDKDKIKNTDAVTMVSELGIIKGMPDGTFSPEGKIDRASMAKMICVAFNGGVEPSTSAATTSYTDTVGNWAAGYIEYCTTLGIVSGKGDKIFAPAANVTGSEAAKMLLVALGYKAETEGFTGASWQTKTDVIANGAGLYVGLEGVPTSDALSRDAAAQMIYNTLNASMIKYAEGQATPVTTSGYKWLSHTDKNGDTTYTAVPSEVEKTMLTAKFGVEKIEGILVATDKVALKGAKVASEGYSTIGGVEVKVTAPMSMLGHQVSVYVTTSSANSTSSSFDKVRGAIISDLKNVITVKYADGKADTKYEVGKNTYNLTTMPNVNVNFGAYSDTVDGVKVTTLPKGTPIFFVENADKSVYALAYDYTYSKVGDLNATKETTKLNGKNIDNDKIFCDETLAKDDMILYFMSGANYVVSKIKVIEGTLEKSSGGKAVIDGEKYDFASFKSDSTSQTLATLDSLMVSGNTNVEKTYYVFDTYVLGIKDGAKEANQYAVIIGSEFKGAGSLGEASVKVKIIMQDGAIETYDLAAIKDPTNPFTYTKDGKNEGTLALFNAAIGADSGKNTLCAYSINSKDKLTLTTMAQIAKDDSDMKAGTVATATDAEFKKGDNKIGSVYADADTVFFTVDAKGTYKAYTGNSNAPHTAMLAPTNYVATKNIADAFLLNGKSTSDSGKFGYVVGYGKEFNSDNETVYNVTLFTNGEDTVYTVDGKALYDNIVKLAGTKVVAYELTDGEVSAVHLATTTLANDLQEVEAVTGFSAEANFVTFDSATSYDMSKDFQAYTIDGDGAGTTTDLFKNDKDDYDVVYTLNGENPKEVNAVYYVEK